MEEKEIWKEIADGRYVISNLGRLKRLKRAKGAVVGKILKPVLTHSELNRLGEPRNYAKIAISYGGGWVKHTMLHKLVAETFLGPCPKGLCVNHKDGNPLNNAASNLEYVTVRDNALHASRLGLLVHGEEHAGSKVTEQDVLDIREAIASGNATYEELTNKYDLNKSSLHSIIYHKTWKHVGGPPAPSADLRRKSNAKLNESQVRAIRKLHAAGFTFAALEEMFGVTVGTLHPLVKGKTWKHIT